jgi:hypothetical protein
MHRLHLTLAVVAAGALVGAGPVAAALPKKGAHFRGTTAQIDEGRAKPISLRVDRRGKAVVRFEYRYVAPCADGTLFENGSASIARHRVTSAGRFRDKRTGILKPYTDGNAVGTLVLEGRFTSARRATGTIRADIEIRTFAGDVVTTCTARTTWSARAH